MADTLRHRASAGTVYVAGALERSSLAAALAELAHGPELARYLCERLPRCNAGAAERPFVTFRTSFVAPPEHFTQYVQDWLLPARTLFDRRRDPELQRCLTPDEASAEPALCRLFELLPALAFAHEGHALRALPLGAAAGREAEPRPAAPLLRSLHVRTGELGITLK